MRVFCGLLLFFGLGGGGGGLGVDQKVGTVEVGTITISC